VTSPGAVVGKSQWWRLKFGVGIDALQELSALSSHLKGVVDLWKRIVVPCTEQEDPTLILQNIPVSLISCWSYNEEKKEVGTLSWRAASQRGVWSSLNCIALENTSSTSCANCATFEYSFRLRCF
jgi:hypothetical protein